MKVCPQEVTSDAEEILDDSVHREKSLRLSRGLKPSHLSLALACRLVGDVRPIVLVLTGSMLHRRKDLAMSCRIASQLVGDQPPGRATLTFQQLTEEAFGGAGVSPSLNQDIKHITVLINAAPEILSSTLDRDEHLIQVPRVAQTALSPLHAASVFRAELEAPQTNGFVGNCDSALCEEVLDVPKAETESVVEPDGVADDLAWKPISAVTWRFAVHRSSLPDTAST